MSDGAIAIVLAEEILANHVLGHRVVADGFSAMRPQRQVVGPVTNLAATCKAQRNQQNNRGGGDAELPGVAALGDTGGAPADRND